ncbi:MAG: DUF3298 domain-containing protein [Anaerolineaceae bacterium]|nr:DUF3298 domain-containing protein [Anaerolineaceae bacterium]
MKILSLVKKIFILLLIYFILIACIINPSQIDLQSDLVEKEASATSPQKATSTPTALSKETDNPKPTIKHSSTPSETISPTETPTTRSTFEIPEEPPVISSIVFNEEQEEPPYKVEIIYPESNDLSELSRFNHDMQEFVFVLKDQFVTNVTEPIEGTSSYLAVDYEVFYNQDGLISLQNISSIYISGAAHPYIISQSFNYDIQLDRFLELEDLFEPDSNYLGIMATICVEELLQRDIGFRGDESGVAPDPFNYMNWTLQPEGILIRFDPAQVAAYAAGPQDVLIPFENLSHLIPINSPIFSILP